MWLTVYVTWELYQQEVCKKLQALIDKVDEERYDAEAKVQKADKEVKVLWHYHSTSSLLKDSKLIELSLL